MALAIRRSLFSIGCSIAGLFISIQPCQADWPQILGPERNGQSSTTLSPSVFDEAPEQIWEAELGQGYAGPAVAGGRVIIFHRLENQEVVDALRLEDGRPIWRKRFATDYRARINPDTGPRCVPVIDGERIYLFGASGNLHCLDFESGAPLWSRDVYLEYRGDEGYFGAGSTPLVVNDTLLVNVGGREEAGIVAFNVETGETAWQMGEDQASYSSPIRTKFQGEDAALFVTRLHAVMVAPGSGRELFRQGFGRTGPTVNAATPLLHDRRVFLTSSYGVGCLMLDLEDAAETLWGNDLALSSQYASPIVANDILVGSHGREDLGGVSLRGIHLDDGSILWEEAAYGVAHLIADMSGKLAILTVDGELVFAEADASGYRELARYPIHRHGSRALPALSNGVFLSRSNAVRGEAELTAHRVGE